jgi:hypothetical protein
MHENQRVEKKKKRDHQCQIKDPMATCGHRNIEMKCQDNSNSTMKDDIWLLQGFSIENVCNAVVWYFLIIFIFIKLLNNF